MAALHLAWNFTVERGPDWLFVRLYPPAEGGDDAFDLANALWQLAEQHFLYRVVLEMEEVPTLRSWLLGQLVLLHKRLAQHGGLLRLSALSANNYAVLHSARLDECFPAYADRGAAVMGYRPHKPR